MDIQTIAALLLALRLISAGFLLLVLAKQITLVRLPAKRYVKLTRVALLALTCAVFIGNIIPIYIDWATIFADLARSTKTVNTVGIAYSLDNATTAALASISIWAVYKLAELSAKAGENPQK